MRSRDFRNAFAEVAYGSRKKTFVPVLPDDTMRYLWDRFADAGDAAVVIVEGDDVGVVGDVVLMRRATAARMEVAQEEGRLVDARDNCSVAMLLALVRTMPEAVLRKTSVQVIKTVPEPVM
jgi:hypothetical protein